MPKTGTVAIGGNSAEQLRSIISRIERLEEEKAEIGADIRDVFAEAKGNGFDVKAMRTVIKLRKMDSSARDEQEHLVDTYRAALGMIAQPDLFEQDGEQEDSEAECAGG